MLRGRGLDDAVSEVEHERATAKRVQDAVGLRVKCGATSDQELRIEVALDAAAKLALYFLRGPLHRHRRVEPDAVHPGRLGEAVVGKSRAARERDDGNARMLRLQRRDDVSHRLHAPSLEERVREDPGPALKELDRLRARLNLSL